MCTKHKANFEREGYPNEEAAVADIHLTFNNAMQFNPPQNAVHAVAKKLFRKFDQKLTRERKQSKATATVATSHKKRPAAKSDGGAAKRKQKTKASEEKSPNIGSVGDKRPSKSRYDAAAIVPEEPEEDGDLTTLPPTSLIAAILASTDAQLVDEPVLVIQPSLSARLSKSAGVTSSISTASLPTPAAVISSTVSVVSGAFDKEACKRVLEAIMDHDCAGPFLEVSILFPFLFACSLFFFSICLSVCIIHHAIMLSAC